MSEEVQNTSVQLKELFKEHDYNKLYKHLAVVTHTINEKLSVYQAIRNVPRFVKITNTRYWKLITNVQDESVEPSEPSEPEPTGPDYLCFTAENDNSSLRVQVVGAPLIVDTFALEYSLDKETWTSVEFNNTSIDTYSNNVITSDVFEFDKDDKLYFRGNNIDGTFKINDDESAYNQLGYIANFVSGDTDNPSVFSVSGDLQTLVDETGEDKEHGCFSNLFNYNLCYLYITTAPDLTATKISNYMYVGLFSNQYLLKRVANIAQIHTTDLPVEYEDKYIELDNYMGGGGSFVAMYYNCISLENYSEFNNITCETYDDYNIIYSHFNMIYAGTYIKIYNDESDTLNGFDNLNIDSNVYYGGNKYFATSNINSYRSACNELKIIDYTVNEDNESYVSISGLQVWSKFFTNTLYDRQNLEVIINAYNATDYIDNTCTISNIFITIQEPYQVVPCKVYRSYDEENWTDVSNSIQDNSLRITIEDKPLTVYKIVKP